MACEWTSLCDISRRTIWPDLGWAARVSSGPPDEDSWLDTSTSGVSNTASNPYTHSHYCTVHSRCRPAPGAGFDIKKIPKPASLNCLISKGSTKTDLNSKKNAQKFKQFATGTKTPKMLIEFKWKPMRKCQTTEMYIYCILFFSL